MPEATPTPGTNIESIMSTCEHCGQPVVSVKLNAGSEWSAWQHALSGQTACQGIPEPPGTTERSN